VNERERQTVSIVLQNAFGQGAQFQISKEYLAPEYHDGGMRGSLHLYIEFPEIRPRQDVSGKAALEALEQGELLPARRPQSVESGYAGYLIIEDTIQDHAAAATERITTRYAERVDDNDPEFRRYWQTYSSGALLAEYLLPKEELDAQSVWIRCFATTLQRPDTTKCTVYTPFGDRLQLQFAIPRRDVGKWRVVDARFKSWLRDLIAGCFEGAQLPLGGRPEALTECPF
jgi:hypothetical protein